MDSCQLLLRDGTDGRRHGAGSGADVRRDDECVGASPSNEVVFVDMGSEDEGEYEPLLGYVILEQAQAAVDMLGHRLVPVKYIDMKSMRRGDFAPSATCRHDTTCAVAAESIVGIEPKWAMQPVGVVAASTVQ